MDWQEMDAIYRSLVGSVYPQPQDEGTIFLRRQAIAWFYSHKELDVRTVIDFGAGDGFCQKFFEERGTTYNGVAWGKDVEVAQNNGRNVIQADFNFLKLDGLIFDAGASFHSLEHSPFPIMTLIHWKRYIRKWLMVVLPHPDWYMAEGQADNVFEQSGWNVFDKRIETIKGSPDRAGWQGYTNYELWYLLEKK